VVEGAAYRSGGISRRDTLDAGPELAREAIVSETPWTIDSIAHALPHPAVRMRFLSEINLAPVDQLQAVTDKWVGFVERWEADRPRLEALRAYAVEHGGELPPEYEATLVDVTDKVLAEAERIRRGAA
jgi:hypothetical protein